MIDVTAIIMILGFIGTIGTTIGAIFWLDKKQTARMDRMDKRFDDQDERQRAMEISIAEMNADLKVQGERLERQDERLERQSVEINAVGRKVDRVEGMVYVLIHGPEYRGRGTASEAETEEPISEPVGDD